MRASIDESRSCLVSEQPEHGRLVIPWDISEWVDKRHLSDWVRSELDTLNWNEPALVECLKKHPQFRPRELLAVCVYAYASGLVESEEIVWNSSREPVLRQLLGNYLPTPVEISRFRKHNRGLIRCMLAQLLKRCIRERYDFGPLSQRGFAA